MNKFSILIIDDEEPQLQSLKNFLQKRDYNVFTSLSGDAALEIIKNSAIDIFLTDFNMPGMNGYQVLSETKAINPSIDVVVMTAYGTIENAVKIMKSGAYDFFNKTN
jgi:DNA-binding NtrC family response regulator